VLFRQHIAYFNYERLTLAAAADERMDEINMARGLMLIGAR
jgi:hypothetical protein